MKKTDRPGAGTAGASSAALRYFLLGLTAGVLGALAPWLLSDPDPVLGEGVAGARPGGSEVAALRSEVARLRSRLGGGGSSVRVEAGAGSEGPGSTGGPAAAGVEPVVGDARMPALLLELDRLVASDALRSQLSTPEALMNFLVGTWLSGGRPEEAVGLLARFGVQEATADLALQAADALLEKGDRDRALHACVLLARAGLKRQELVDRALKLGPARILEELSALAQKDGSEWEDWKAQRSALLLAAGNKDEALRVMDGLLAEKKLPDWIWGELIERAPKEAATRLQSAIAAAGDGARNGLQCQLAMALDNQGRSGEAVAMLRKLMGEELDAEVQVTPEVQALERERVHYHEIVRSGFLSLPEREVAGGSTIDVIEDVTEAAASRGPSALETFQRVDPKALCDFLADRARKQPTARHWALYGDSLAQGQRTDDAIAAWTEAVRLDPHSSAAASLVAHSPVEASRLLRRRAAADRDDELLGDLGDAMWQAGRKSEAIGLWEQAHDIDRADSEWTEKLSRARSNRNPL